ncbi:MAG: transcriptional regulator [Gemmatimonadota bacterium]|nr:transcriptional regulator [Gemmatimonadota bacterium]
MARSAASPKSGADSERERVRAEPGRATTALDPLIHQRTRLAIVSALATGEELSFNDLKRLTRATDGNLSVHARKLEDAGYVVCTKSFQDRTPLTEYRLSAAGRKALERYLDHMEALIAVTRDAR